MDLSSAALHESGLFNYSITDTSLAKPLFESQSFHISVITQRTAGYDGGIFSFGAEISILDFEFNT
jgi:hypothetical protein